MTVREDSLAGLFRTVCVFFSTVLLVMMLLTRIDIAELSERALKTEEENEHLRIENGILTVQYENRLSLAEIESCATQRLGLRHCTPDQTEYIVLD